MSSLLYNKVEADQVYTRLGKSIDRIEATIDFKRFNQDILAIHEMRSSRVLKVHLNANLQKIIDANLDDQSSRSRLCQIKLTASTAQFRLSESMSLVTSHISYTYRTIFQDIGMKTRDARDSFIVSLPLMVNASECLNDLTALIENCNLIIEDIDKYSYTFKNILKAFELAVHRESII